MWVATRKLPVDPRIRTLLNATFGMAALQVTFLCFFLFLKSLNFEGAAGRKLHLLVLTFMGYYSVF